jgi:single-strand DNA-binding protein
MNRICIVGRLTADPSSKNFGTSTMAEFSVAVRKMRKEEADFFNVKSFGKTADFVLQYLSKGRMVAVSGRMESRKHTNQDGKTTTYWDLVADTVDGLDKAEGERQVGSKIKDNDPWIRSVPPPPLLGEEIEDPFAD